MDFKTGKTIEIIKEFLAGGGDRFEINGIDLSKAVFMYRERNSSFIPIPRGNYTTSTENNSLYLNVIGDVKTKAYEYQVIYTSDMKAGKYLEEYPELKVLVSKYNDLIEDVTNIIKYAKSTGVKVDTLKMTQILTPLEPNTFWVMNEDEKIVTFPLGDLNSKYEQMVSKLKKEVEELIKSTKETSLSEIEAAAKNKISEFTEELKKKINELNTIFNKAQENIKNSVDRLNNNEKEAIKEFERILSEKINSLNTLSDELKNSLSSAVAKYIADNRDKLKGDRGAGIISISAIGDKVTVNYDDNKNTVFKVPTVPGKDGREIQDLSYTNNKLKITMSDNTSKEVEIKSGVSSKEIFKGTTKIFTITWGELKKYNKIFIISRNPSGNIISHYTILKEFFSEINKTLYSNTVIYNLEDANFALQIISNNSTWEDSNKIIFGVLGGYIEIMYILGEE